MNSFYFARIIEMRTVFARCFYNTFQRYTYIYMTLAFSAFNLLLALFSSTESTSNFFSRRLHQPSNFPRTPRQRRRRRRYGGLATNESCYAYKTQFPIPKNRRARKGKRARQITLKAGRCAHGQAIRRGFTLRRDY